MFFPNGVLCGMWMHAIISQQMMRKLNFDDRKQIIEKYIFFFASIGEQITSDKIINWKIPTKNYIN